MHYVFLHRDANVKLIFDTESCLNTAGNILQED